MTSTASSASASARSSSSKAARLFFFTAALLLLVGRVRGQAAAAGCSDDCTGPNDSCLYCPDQCGTCDSVGVITQCREAGTVHLGLDDGPFENTPKILDILLSKNIKASFFIIGDQVAGQEGVMQRTMNEGHYLGDHTWTHLHADSLNETALNNYFVPDELLQTRTAIQQSVAPAGYTATQVPVNHYRAPYGELNKNVLAAVTNAGFTTVLWNLDLNDWMENGTVIDILLNSTLDWADPRSDSFIFLYHAAAATSLSYLPVVIDRFQNAGFRFVSPWDCYLPPISSSTGGVSSTGVGAMSSTGGAAGAMSSTASVSTVSSSSSSTGLAGFLSSTGLSSIFSSSSSSTGTLGLTGGGVGAGAASSAPGLMVGSGPNAVAAAGRALFTLVAGLAVAAGLLKAAF